MFAVRSLPRLSARSTPFAGAVVPAQRTFFKQLLGIVPEQTPEEKKQSEAERVPLMQGPGAKLGTVPTDYEQATGVERYQMLGNMAGIDVFNQKPIKMDRMGTMEDPLQIPCVINERIFGCSGFPADSHDIIWQTVKAGEIKRCDECGNCMELTYHNPWAMVIPEVAEEAKGAKPLSMPHDDHHH